MVIFEKQIPDAFRVNFICKFYVTRAALARAKGKSNPMISSKHLGLALDQIKNANPVAELAENLFNSGVTEDQLRMALAGRSDPIAVELQSCHRQIQSGVTPTNRYGVAKRTNSTRPQRRQA